MQLLTKYGKFMPLQLKKKIAVWLDNSVFRINTSTVMFSNIGYVKFPKEIQEKVEHIEGILCYEKRCPYKFCVISTGNVLTLTVTFSVKEKEIVNRIVSNIRKGECDLH